MEPNGTHRQQNHASTTTTTTTSPPPPPRRSPPDERPYVILVSAKFLVWGLISSLLLALAVGHAARILLLRRHLPQQQHYCKVGLSSMRHCDPETHHHHHHDYWSQQQQQQQQRRDGSSLPSPIAKKGRPLPETVYTSKNFNTARTATSASLLLRRNERDDDTEPPSLVNFPVCTESETQQCSRTREPPLLESLQQPQQEDDDDHHDEEHLPAGQHLLVDMRNVDGSFLNSEERLATAMVKVVEEASLTLLSYHCHRLVPAGVSCVGVLLESHVSFHTWPVEGVITLDLFTCGSNPLVPVVPLIESLFGVPRKNTNGHVQLKWAHKLRGFRPHKSGPLETWDLGINILGDIEMEMKQTVASITSEYQQLDIFDVIIPQFNSLSKYRRSLSGDGSYESLHPELFRPDRILFLDGMMQSRRQGDAAYHEGLVHPAMFAHKNPQRVAIIGGGEGSTLSEVLKHNTVTEVTMIEIDNVMVSASREFLPEWSDCSDLVDSADWCGDDPRARIIGGDALAWFVDQYGVDQNTAPPLDVIVMDALDPETDAPFAKALFDDLDFMKALHNALSDDGIMVIQLGTSPEVRDPSEQHSRYRNRSNLFALLNQAGFASIHVYEESHCGFSHAWTYAVAFKEYNARGRWYASEAEIQIAIQRRAKRTKSGRVPFEFFDGPTMVSYQVPPKTAEIVFCRQNPVPEECSSSDLEFDMDIPNIPRSSFEVKASGVAPNAGRGVYTKVDIGKEAYVGAEESVNTMHIMPSTLAIIESLEDTMDEATDLTVIDTFTENYGFRSYVYGGVGVSVDCGILTFVNHGCHGTYNIGSASNMTEETAVLGTTPKDMTQKSHDFVESIYSPFIDRHLPYVSAGPDQTLRHVSEGEEILTNYLYYTGLGDAWAEDVEELRRMCRG